MKNQKLTESKNIKATAPDWSGEQALALEEGETVEDAIGHGWGLC